jgi:hypothetical protein
MLGSQGVMSAQTLFDGQTLAGWRMAPRLPTAPYPGAAAPDPRSEVYLAASAHPARWSVKDGAIVGEQDPSGGGFGGYLVSEDVFGGFELELEAWPDWPADTGIMVRATPLGSQGFQILVDHRRSGGIGGFYGNGIGGFHALSYNVDARYGDDARPTGLVLEDPGTTLELVTDEKRSLLRFAAPPAVFFSAWRWASWNTFRIRCEGDLPVLTTWVNGHRIYEMDASSIHHPRYNPQAVSRLLGRKGHIALEVHDTDARLGPARWGPDAVCRWRNIQLETL